MVSRLKGLQARFPCIGDVRGLGAMVAIELVKNRRPDSPDTDLTKALVQAAGRRGLVILACGMYGNVIRFLAPLTISDALLKEGINLFEQSLDEVRARRRRQERRGRLTAGVGLGPAGVRVGRGVEVLALGGELLDSFLSSAMRPSAVLMGMQSWQRGSPQGWRE